MNWKQFLKPDWRKILLFIILLLIFYSIKVEQEEQLRAMMGIDVYAACCAKIMDQQGNLRGGTLEGCASQEIIQKYKSCEGMKISMQNEELFSNVKFFLFFGIISYLLSCLIVWIYDKFRKNK
jgi:hypothetical protein